jgi:cell division septation protein DedD
MKGRAVVVSVVATCALLVTPLSALARLGGGAVSALHPAALPAQPATDATEDSDNTDGTDATTTSPADSAVRATYTGTVDLADSAHTDLTATRRGLFSHVPVGGLSGMDCDPGTGTTGTTTGMTTHCLALSDDRGQHGPVRAYPLDLTLDPATTNPMTTTPTTTEPNPTTTTPTTTKPNPDPIPASTTLTHVTVGAPLVLTDSDGTPYRPGTVDPESIRLTPDGMVWSSEGDESLGAPAAVTAADSTGRARFTYRLPDHHRLRPNAGYEALAVRGDRTFVLTEAPLRQDALNRLTVYDATTGVPTAEYPYPLSPVTGPAAGATTGASEMIAAPDGSLLTLERGWRKDLGNVATLYRITLDGASDVLGADRIPDAARPVHKQKLLDLGAVVGTRNLDNVESLAWAGNTLLIGTDDNFSGDQRSLIHTVTVTGVGQ